MCDGSGLHGRLTLACNVDHVQEHKCRRGAYSPARTTRGARNPARTRSRHRRSGAGDGRERRAWGRIGPRARTGGRSLARSGSTSIRSGQTSSGATAAVANTLDPVSAGVAHAYAAILRRRTGRSWAIVPAPTPRLEQLGLAHQDDEPAGDGLVVTTSPPMSATGDVLEITRTRVYEAIRRAGGR